MYITNPQAVRCAQHPVIIPEVLGLNPDQVHSIHLDLWQLEK
jgi:hypothetical protein